MSYVMRGAIATPDVRQKGYQQHQNLPQIDGLSIQYAAKQNTILKEVALAGHILNGQISHASVDEMMAAWWLSVASCACHSHRYMEMRHPR